MRRTARRARRRTWTPRRRPRAPLLGHEHVRDRLSRRSRRDLDHPEEGGDPLLGHLCGKRLLVEHPEQCADACAVILGSARIGACGGEGRRRRVRHRHRHGNAAVREPKGGGMGRHRSPWPTGLSGSPFIWDRRVSDGPLTPPRKIILSGGPVGSGRPVRQRAEGRGTGTPPSRQTGRPRRPTDARPEPPRARLGVPAPRHGVDEPGPPPRTPAPPPTSSTVSGQGVDPSR